MIYFVVNRDKIKEDHWNKCEMMLLTALGSYCGQYTVLCFTKENAPNDLGDPMTEEDFNNYIKDNDYWPKMGTE